MAIIGKRTKGATAVEVATDTKRVARFGFPAAARLPKLSAYVDGLGSGSLAGVARLRGVVYDAVTDSLVALGDEVLVPRGQAGGWVDLPFVGGVPGGAAVAPQNYDIGVLVGGDTLVARVWEDAPASPYNLLYGNPSFETDISGWDSSASSFWINPGATLTRAPAPAGPPSGGWAMHVQKTGAESLGGAQYRNFPVVAGKTYTFSAYLNGTGQVSLGMGKAGVGSAQTAYNTLAGTWTRYQVTLVATATGMADLAFQVSGTTTADFYADAVQVVEGSSPGTFTTAAPSGGRANADAYADGAAASFGASSALQGFSVYAQPFLPWAAPVELEMWYGRLPFHEAQVVLGSTGVQVGSVRTGTCSWHGTQLDPERGSFVVAQAGGKFDDWVGERVKITSHASGVSGAAVFGYVHNALDLDDDISVPRRMFADLDVLGKDSIAVVVELMR